MHPRITEQRVISTELHADLYHFTKYPRQCVHQMKHTRNMKGICFYTYMWKVGCNLQEAHKQVYARSQIDLPHDKIPSPLSMLKGTNLLPRGSQPEFAVNCVTS